MNVIRVQPREVHHWLVSVHYAKRIPSISHAFGLFDGTEPLGYVTYGTPSSAPLRQGVAGVEYADKVLELNRLVFPNPVEDGPSILVSKSLRMLPRPSIVVSYADTAMGHIGYVYQACNFMYTGLSAKRTDWKIRGMEHMHGQTIADISRHVSSGRAEYMRERFGDDFYLSDRPRKHRYIFITGSKSQKKQIRQRIIYDEQPYPKGDSKRYVLDSEPATQMGMFA